LLKKSGWALNRSILTVTGGWASKQDQTLAGTGRRPLPAKNVCAGVFDKIRRNPSFGFFIG
jgi:hypothetical protein